MNLVNILQKLISRRNFRNKMLVKNIIKKFRKETGFGSRCGFQIIWKVGSGSDEKSFRLHSFSTPVCAGCTRSKATRATPSRSWRVPWSWPPTIHTGAIGSSSRYEAGLQQSILCNRVLFQVPDQQHQSLAKSNSSLFSRFRPKYSPVFWI